MLDHMDAFAFELCRSVRFFSWQVFAKGRGQIDQLLTVEDLCRGRLFGMGATDA